LKVTFVITYLKKHFLSAWFFERVAWPPALTNGFVFIFIVIGLIPSRQIVYGLMVNASIQLIAYFLVSGPSSVVFFLFTKSMCCIDPGLSTGNVVIQIFCSGFLYNIAQIK